MTTTDWLAAFITPAGILALGIWFAWLIDPMRGFKK